MRTRTWLGGLLLVLLASVATAAKLSWTIENAAGETQPGLTLQLKLAGTSTVVAATSGGTIVDHGDGSYITSGDLPSGEYSVFSGSGSGTLIPALAYLAHIDPDDLTAVRPINQGGTASATAAGARTNLGLAIGVNVQAWSQDLDLWNTMSAAARAGSIHYWPYFNTDTNAWTALSAAENRDRLGLEINADVQSYSPHLSEYVTGRTLAAAAGLTAVPIYDPGSGAVGFAAASLFKEALGLEVGTDIQAWSQHLDDLADVVDGAASTVLLGVDAGFVTGFEAPAARTALGLGSAATLDATSTGEAGKLARYTSDAGGGALIPPTRSSHPAATAANLGMTYIMATGNIASGSWGIYTIERNSNGVAYTYAVRALVERTW